MRLGLDLRHLSGDALIERATEADRLGLWAVAIDGPDGTGTLVGAELAVVTRHLHLAIWTSEGTDHVTTLAEELSVLDHLSTRRSLALAAGTARWTDHLRRLLAGEIVDAFAVAPPPAQTAIPVWDAETTTMLALTGTLETDRRTIDDLRDGGTTHAFVRWDGSLGVLARHLASRALTPDFPEIVADHADVIAPEVLP